MSTYTSLDRWREEDSEHRQDFLICFVALDVTTNSICEIHCLALDVFDLNTVHKLSSREKKSRWSPYSNPGLLGGKQECFLCGMQPPIFDIFVGTVQEEKKDKYNTSELNKK